MSHWERLATQSQTYVESDYQKAGYRLVMERSMRGAERLTFTPIPVDPFAAILRRRRRATASGEKL